MPLYEIELQLDDRSEVRLTDRKVAIGDTIEINSQEWVVVLERDPHDVAATARFLCELTKEQRRRNKRIRELNDELRQRIEMKRKGAPSSPP